MTSASSPPPEFGLTRAERDAVLEFWFGFHTFERKKPNDKRRSRPVIDGDRQAQWWKSSERLDARIRKEFGALHQRLATQHPSSLWNALDGAEDVIAAIVVLDQFSRQIHRNEAEAFAQDGLARQLCKRALLSGMFETVEHPMTTLFGLMPLMHSEDPQDQARSLDLQQRLAMTVADEDPAIKMVQASVHAAKEHKKVIDTFGRFPKRNPALGRTSTAKEKQHQKKEGPV